MLATFPHGAPVRAALAMPNGIVTAGDDGIVRRWTRGGQQVWASTPGAPITAAAAASDGTIAAGGNDGTIRVWAPDGRLLHTMHGHTLAVTTLAFSRDGSELASGSEDHTARIWDPSSGRLLHLLARHHLAVTDVAFSPDGTLFATASADGDAILWRVATGVLAHDLRFHISTVSSVAFSSDGRWLVTAGPSTAGLWQVRTGTLLAAVGSPAGPLTAAAFAPGRWRFVTGGGDGAVRTYACDVCGPLPSLEPLARHRLAALGLQP